ncbi:hypothetical protein [Cupriavidus sp. TMH.W2]|uniref:hypothetical protein n=1 Tax=Cupriavidus sp. TMH.W2 TaxID=3434465 RepID=UPI003D76E2F2
MAFLAAATFVLYAHMISAFRALMRHGRLSVMSGLHVATATVGAGAILSGFGLFDDPKIGVRLDSVNWCVPLFFLLGIATLILFGGKFVGTVKEGRAMDTSAGLRFGMIVWAMMAGTYLTFAVADHWWFFRDQQNSGVAEARLLGGTDVPCDGLALVRIDAESAAYRCPSSLVWGGAFRQWPFAPWPSYQEGESVLLKKGIEEAQRSALHSPSDQSGNSQRPQDQSPSGK